jgi:hypothetical protein
VIVRDFRGHFDSELIGERLGATEVAPPHPGAARNGLARGQYYVDRASGGHPELHCLVTEGDLATVADLARDLHVRIVAGAELLPGRRSPAPDRHHASAIEVLEARHRPPWSRGPLALLRVAATVLVIAGVLLGAGLVAVRHLGDHHQTVSASTLMVRAARPPTQQGALQHLVDPDHADQVRLEMRGVRYVENDRLVLDDGSYVELVGAGDLRAHLERARDLGMVPHLDARLRDGRILVERLAAGDRDLWTGGELVRHAWLGESDRRPARGEHGSERVFAIVRSIPFDDRAVIAGLVGRRISVTGHLEPGEGELVLRMDGGTGIRLATPSGERLRRSLEVFARPPVQLRLDIVLTSVAPWRDRRHPERSRGTTRIIGDAEVYSLSAQSYHVVARR